jgi:hypothetical protein
MISSVAISSNFDIFSFWLRLVFARWWAKSYLARITQWKDSDRRSQTTLPHGMTVMKTQFLIQHVCLHIKATQLINNLRERSKLNTRSRTASGDQC